MSLLERDRASASRSGPLSTRSFRHSVLRTSHSPAAAARTTRGARPPPPRQGEGAGLRVRVRRRASRRPADRRCPNPRAGRCRAGPFVAGHGVAAGVGEARDPGIQRSVVEQAEATVRRRHPNRVSGAQQHDRRIPRACGSRGYCRPSRGAGRGWKTSAPLRRGARRWARAALRAGHRRRGPAHPFADAELGIRSANRIVRAPSVTQKPTNAVDRLTYLHQHIRHCFNLEKPMRLLTGTDVHREVVRIMSRTGEVMAAVAYWGDGASERTGITRKKSRNKARVICDLLSGACNPAEIDKLMKLGVQVKTLDRLHAKIWIGGNTVILGSANASKNGLPDSYGRNAHCCAPPAQIRTWSLDHTAPTSGV